MRALSEGVEAVQSSEDLSRFARSVGAIDYFGVADLAPARGFVDEQSDGLLSELDRAVSIGKALPDAVVDMLPFREKRAVRVSYLTHGYEVVNRRLDMVASGLASLLQKIGYRAFPVASSERVDDGRICAVFSHKLAAHLSGLGWIGKSCLLVTPEHGPRVRWATVLTDAPLVPTGQPMAERCGTCTACTDICPVKAFSGRPFREDEPRESRYRADLCDSYFHQSATGLDRAVCGMCLYICPFGRSQDGREV